MNVHGNKLWRENKTKGNVTEEKQTKNPWKRNQTQRLILAARHHVSILDNQTCAKRHDLLRWCDS